MRNLDRLQPRSSEQPSQAAYDALTLVGTPLLDYLSQGGMGSFRGLYDFHEMLLDIAAQASSADLDDVSSRHLMQAGGLGQVRCPAAKRPSLTSSLQ